MFRCRRRQKIGQDAGNLRVYIIQRNDDFLWANKRSLSRAKQAAREIPYLEPFTVIPETEFVDQTYYDQHIEPKSLSWLYLTP